jgi:hypothetical protein
MPIAIWLTNWSSVGYRTMKDLEILQILWGRDSRHVSLGIHCGGSNCSTFDLLGRAYTFTIFLTWRFEAKLGLLIKPKVWSYLDVLWDHSKYNFCAIDKSTFLKGGPGASSRVLPPVTGRSWVRVAVSSHCTGEGKACHWHPSPDPAQSGSSLHGVRPLDKSTFLVEEKLYCIKILWN